MTLKKLLKIYRALGSHVEIEAEEKRIHIIVDILEEIHKKIKKK